MEGGGGGGERTCVIFRLIVCAFYFILVLSNIVIVLLTYIWCSPHPPSPHSPRSSSVLCVFMSCGSLTCSVAFQVFVQCCCFFPACYFGANNIFQFLSFLALFCVIGVILLFFLFFGLHIPDPLHISTVFCGLILVFCNVLEGEFPHR